MTAPENAKLPPIATEVGSELVVEVVDADAPATDPTEINSPAATASVNRLRRATSDVRIEALA